MKPSRFEYLAPETCEEALGALAEHGDDAAVLAGGQSLIPMMNLRIAAPGVLIDVMRTPDLRGIRCENGRTEIGAGVRMAEAEQDSTVPLLQRALRHVGHPAIRNAGTVCGSVAHADPAAELPAVLLALDGEVVLRSVRGERIVAADEFFRSYYMTAREPDELVVAVRIPAYTSRVAFHEATPRLGGSGPSTSSTSRRGCCCWPICCAIGSGSPARRPAARWARAAPAPCCSTGRPCAQA